MKNLDLQSLVLLANQMGQKLKPYLRVLFFLLFALVYGFVILKINTFSNAQVNPADVDAQVKASPTLHIDANAAKQLQTLKDNSVNVQTLFEQSRTNPFKE